MGDFGSFGWLFQSGLDAMISSLLSMGAKHAELADTVRQLARSVPFISLTWIVWNLVRGKPTNIPLGVFITSLLIFVALQNQTVTFPGRAGMEMTKGQSIALEVILPTYEKLAQVYRTKDNEQSTLMIADLTEREISPFMGSDLANLMKDYKQYCEPGPNDKANITDTAWQAVGLRGGGALGVPDSQVSVFSSATADELSGLSFSWFPQIRQALAIIDTYKAGDRRSAGKAALEQLSSDKWPTGKRYLLPSETGWQSRLSGGVDKPTGFLNPWKVANGSLADPALLSEPSGVANRYFVPENCYEAYQAAQAGAEEGYRAVGDRIRPSNLSPDSEPSIVAGVRAWSDVVNKSLSSLYSNSGDSSFASKIRENASEAVGALNEAKGALATLDLAAKLPWFVYLTAMGQAVLIHIFPLVALFACVFGIEILLYWIRLLVFTFLSLFFAEGILYLLASQLAKISFIQAATAISSSGTPLDIDGIRGVLASGAGFVILAATWAAGALLRIQSLPKADGATSFTQLGSVAASIAGSVVGGFTKMAAMKTAGLKQDLLRAKIQKIQGPVGSPGASPSGSPTGSVSDTPAPSRQSRESAGQRLSRPGAPDQAEYQQKNRTTRADRAERRRSLLSPPDNKS
ncbi:hypothetical protein [Pseudomonas rubra]|uniref:TraG-like protein, N-terminal region n=1 Tax=Pseudomonas rubra TaxID=2942627 RepID=A0ABT5PFQ2_9PSED|nr:hypothetical protein [Pseudomonas rubra]MDD1016952.1 hypothetical protein [Pseudomonas rubra]MDD1041051.1 hypothetical protein [Pseudomonas rubra]MDD1157478.1 hypothetical protein [Pseudomonas rubra]